MSDITNIEQAKDRIEKLEKVIESLGTEFLETKQDVEYITEKVGTQSKPPTTSVIGEDDIVCHDFKMVEDQLRQLKADITMLQDKAFNTHVFLKRVMNYDNRKPYESLQDKRDKIKLSHKGKEMFPGGSSSSNV